MGRSTCTGPIDSKPATICARWGLFVAKLKLEKGDRYDTAEVVSTNPVDVGISGRRLTPSVDGNIVKVFSADVVEEITYSKGRVAKILEDSDL